MQLKVLKIFCDVVSLQSFSQAAELNNVTQSTASQSVHRLEKHLGVQLINRSVRPWKITAIGRQCYGYCHDVLQAYNRLEREIGKLQSQVHRRFRIGCIYSVGFSYMPQCTESFAHVDTPDELHIEYLHPETIISRVLNDELDLGIASFPPKLRELGVIQCGEEDLVIVYSPKHQFAKFSGITPAQLEEQEFVGFDQDLVMSRKIKNLLKGIGISQRVCMRFDNIEAIKRAVEDSEYIAILPYPTLKRELVMGTLCSQSLDNVTFTRPIGVIFKKNRPLAPSLQRFIEIFQDIVGVTNSSETCNISNQQMSYNEGLNQNEQ